VETEDARDIICEQVEKLQADILVMGSHGYGHHKKVCIHLSFLCMVLLNC
jgi:nucleotide-binding universal stress UspA family protein